MSERPSNVLPFQMTARTEKRRLLRAATKEAEHLYHITGGFVNLMQIPEYRKLFEEGLLEH